MDITEFAILMIFCVGFFLIGVAKKGRHMALFTFFAAIVAIFTYTAVTESSGITQYLGSTPTNETVVPYNNLPFDWFMVLFIMLCFMFTMLKAFNKI
jgi:hypothetical protein